MLYICNYLYSIKFYYYILNTIGKGWDTSQRALNFLSLFAPQHCFSHKELQFEINFLYHLNNTLLLLKAEISQMFYV